MADQTQEIFSFHSFPVPLYQIPWYLFGNRFFRKSRGLIHSECLIPMLLGESLFSWKRYRIQEVVVFALWNSEKDLNDFLEKHKQGQIQKGWHLRLRMYRRWGSISEFSLARVNDRISKLDSTTVAITLARLKLKELFRFTKWGKPVETQVRNHPGKQKAFAAFRPPRHFLTFSVWDTEADMIQMVQGKNPNRDGSEHKEAMEERSKKDFHFEFTTLRFEIVGESGFVVSSK